MLGIGTGIGETVIRSDPVILMLPPEFNIVVSGDERVMDNGDYVIDD